MYFPEEFGNKHVQKLIVAFLIQLKWPVAEGRLNNAEAARHGQQVRRICTGSAQRHKEQRSATQQSHHRQLTCDRGVQTGRWLLTRETRRGRGEGATKSSPSVLLIERKSGPMRSVFLCLFAWSFVKPTQKVSITFHWCIRQRRTKKCQEALPMLYKSSPTSPQERSPVSR